MMRLLLLLLYASAIHLVSPQGDRLILHGGNGPCQGHIWVWHENEWGLVGRDGWKKANDKVVCKSIGCGDVVSSKDEQYLRGMVKWMNEVNCTGDETNLWNCVFPGWKESVDNVDLVKKITCSESITLSLSPFKCAGVIQFSKSKEDGYFCMGDGSFDQHQADKLCQQLGCGASGTIPPLGVMPAKNTKATLKLGRCYGNETHLWQCGIGDQCNDKEPIAVICSGHTDLRLRGGSHVCTGDLEVKEDNQWVPVCRSKYKLNETSADDMCSQMRCGKNLTPRPYPMVCNGSNNITLTCSESIQISLSGTCFGSVHVDRSGNRGVVCGDKWGNEEAEVVCRERECGKVISANTISHSGTPGTLDKVSCTGSEASLWHCLAKSVSSRCNQAAYVICSDSVNVRLSDSPGQCAGRVEIQYEGTWGNVKSSSNSDKANSERICQKLQCGNPMSKSDHFSHNTDPQSNKMYSLNCNGNKKSVSECAINVEKRPQGEPMMLTCQEHKVLYLEGPPASACSGNVGIMYNSTQYWLSGSNDTWDRHSAEVVCDQMLCGSLVSMSSEAWSLGKAEIWKDSYNCLSNETSLFDCEKRVPRSSQNHRSIASVKCSGDRTVRLAHRCLGKVDVCASGWCGGVSAETWTDDMSKKLCLELGCGEAILPNTERDTKGVAFKSLHSIQGSKNLTQYNFVKYDASRDKNKAAYVTCSGSVTARLTDDRDNCSGNLEIFYKNAWLPVCRDALKNPQHMAADTICRELDCGKAITQLNYFGNPKNNPNNIAVTTIECKANSNASADCKISESQVNCPLAGLQCSDWKRMVMKAPEEDGGACEGSVFIHSNDSFALSRASMVSSEGWNHTEGNMLCKNLNCGSYLNHMGKEGIGHSWWNKSFDCGGEEKNIWKCEQNIRPAQKQQLYLRCKDNPIVKLEHHCFGKVKMGDHSVCADGWNMEQSQIACRGCSNAIDYTRISDRANFAKEATYVSCIGSESHLGQCKTAKGQCNDVISVSCVGGIKFNVSEKCGGKVEIFYKGKKESVCPFNPMSREAQLLCNDLGCEEPFMYEEETDEQVVPETSLICEKKRELKHCVGQTSCAKTKPAHVYCKGYHIKQPGPKIPANLIVGVSLGVLGLIVVVALFLFLRHRFIKRNRHRYSATARKESAFESGDYEDVGTDINEMNNLSSLGSRKDDNQEEGRTSAASSLSYDDIAGDITEENLTTGHPTSRPNGDSTHGNHEHVRYEVEDEEPQGSYDDVSIIPTTASAAAALVHVIPRPQHGRDDIGDNDLEANTDEDYLQPDQQGCLAWE